MANTRDIRRRIKSIKNTAQITKAMQMVAASKMRKAQQLAIAGRPYIQLMNTVLEHCKRRGDVEAHPLLEERPVRRTGLLIISTNRGLCGGLNTNLFREIAAMDPAKTRFVTAGRKARQQVARLGHRLIADFDMPETLTMAFCRTISTFMMEEFLKGEIDQMEVLYSEFVSTIHQRPVRRRILPIQEIDAIPAVIHGHSAEIAEKPSIGPEVEPLFEPSASEVLSALLPHYVHLQLYQCGLEAKASEHSARMVAMKSATDNAKQLVKDLTLEYNKVRQAGITNEILEIATAQMAMG